MDGTETFKPSDNANDWLGPGMYFWQSDPQRALEWANERTGPRAYREPFVVGAVIDLGNCLDLTERRNIALVAAAFDSFKKLNDEAGKSLPSNKSAKYDAEGDFSQRFLDNAVMRHLHEYAERQGEKFDTVLGLFTEGTALYPDSVFKTKTHCQIAVLNEKCVRGFFLPLCD